MSLSHHPPTPSVLFDSLSLNTHIWALLKAGRFCPKVISKIQVVLPVHPAEIPLECPGFRSNQISATLISAVQSPAHLIVGIFLGVSGSAVLKGCVSESHPTCHHLPHTPVKCLCLLQAACPPGPVPSNYQLDFPLQRYEFSCQPCQFPSATACFSQRCSTAEEQPVTTDKAFFPSSRSLLKSTGLLWLPTATATQCLPSCLCSFECVWSLCVP